MRLKIKWNDDRVRAAVTAVLLIGRDRLSRGESEDLIRASMAMYRENPDGYKTAKSAWPDVREMGPLKQARDVAYYGNLLSAVDRLMETMTRGKRQFNSLTELDNFLISALKNVR